MVLELVAIACIAAVAYTYIGYPFVAGALAIAAQASRDAAYIFGKRDRRVRAPQEWPHVAVVISAFNEERHIGRRIENLLGLDYPADRLHVYIGSDGSTDATPQILAQCRDPRVIALSFDANRGKATVLNDLVGRTREPIVVFSDANTFFDAQAVRHLVSRFNDPAVGAVSGELRLIGVAGDNQDSLYWRLEQYLKFCESRVGALLGANGAIYAIRRPLWQPLRADTICDDFCVAMSVAAAGHRLAYEPAAWAEEESPPSIEDEHRRRVRIGIGNFQALVRHPEYLFRTSAATAFAYLSHKVLRWLAPHLLLCGLAASLVLAVGSSAWLVFAALQLLAYVGAALLYVATGRGHMLAPALRLPAFLFALHWAFLIASLRYAAGRYAGSWGRTSR